VEDVIDTRFMFLAVSAFDSNSAIRGAFVTTDVLTKPLEFRCTTPIRPTKLQKILYGDSLREHLLVELIAVPLFQAAKEKPAVVLVTDSSFLPLRRKFEVPVLWVGKHADAASVLPQEANAEDHVVTSPTGSYEPVAVTTHRDFIAEAQDARKLLAPLMGPRGLTRPVEGLGACRRIAA
jgi:hypothetical protein